MELAALTALLAPYCVDILQKGSDALAAKAPEWAEKAWDVIKSRLSSPSATKSQQGAIEELEAAPEDTGNQTQFSVQLEKALTNDPDLLAQIQALVPPGEIKQFCDNTQTATAKNGSKVNQIIGSGNTVG